MTSLFSKKIVSIRAFNRKPHDVGIGSVHLRESKGKPRQI